MRNGSSSETPLKTITEDELTTILQWIEDGENVHSYIGFEPSGPVHIGTWLSVFKLLDVQRAGLTPIVLLTDLHAQMSDKGELDWLQKVAEYWEAVIRALNLAYAV